MARSPSPKDVAQGFTEIVVETIEALGSMIEQLSQRGLAESAEVEVAVISALAGKYETELVTMFLDKCEVWENILNKNIKFFTSDVLELFADIPADLSCLVVPVTTFLAHQAGEIECKDFPILQEDIDVLWEYFNGQVTPVQPQRLEAGLLHYHGWVFRHRVSKDAYQFRLVIWVGRHPLPP